MSLELRSQLAKGVFDLYTSAYMLTSDTLKKLIDDNTKAFLNTRRYIYTAKAFIYMKEVINENFKKTGEGYGKQIAYANLAKDCVNLAAKDSVINISKNFIAKSWKFN